MVGPGSPALPVASLKQKGYSVGFFREPTGLRPNRVRLRRGPPFCILLSTVAFPLGPGALSRLLFFLSVSCARPAGVGPWAAPR